MPKARLIFDGDGVYTEKEARIHKLTQETETKIENIPGVVDDVNSTSTTDALSANMGKYLQDQINNMSGTTTFLSTWDCTTGLPETEPSVDPYTYKTGNYYIVNKVAASGGINYKPHGATYTHGVPSTSVETGEISINDWYIYDGQSWIIQPASDKVIVVDDMLKPNSTNAVENRAIYSALTTKQDKILDLTTIREGAALGATSIQPGDNITELTNNVGYQTAGDVAGAIGEAIEELAPEGVGTGVLTLQKNSTTLDTFSANALQDKTINIQVPTTVAELSDASDYVTDTELSNTLEDYATKDYVDGNVIHSGPTAPSPTEEGMLWYDTVNDVLKVYDGTQWNLTGKVYSSGNGINVDNTNDTISNIGVLSVNGSTGAITGIATENYVNGTIEEAIDDSKYVGPAAPSNPTEGMLWYDTTNGILKVYNGTQWNQTGKVYSAGEGINVDNTNDTISNTGVLSINGDAGDVNIKTVNNQSLIGNGNIDIGGGYSGIGDVATVGLFTNVSGGNFGLMNNTEQYNINLGYENARVENTVTGDGVLDITITATPFWNNINSLRKYNIYYKIDGIDEDTKGLIRPNGDYSSQHIANDASIVGFIPHPDNVNYQVNYLSLSQYSGEDTLNIASYDESGNHITDYNFYGELGLYDNHYRYTHYGFGIYEGHASGYGINLAYFYPTGQVSKGSICWDEPSLKAFNVIGVGGNGRYIYYTSITGANEVRCSGVFTVGMFDTQDKTWNDIGHAGTYCASGGFKYYEAGNIIRVYATWTFPSAEYGGGYIDINRNDGNCDSFVSMNQDDATAFMNSHVNGVYDNFNDMNLLINLETTSDGIAYFNGENVGEGYFVRGWDNVKNEYCYHATNLRKYSSNDGYIKVQVNGASIKERQADGKGWGVIPNMGTPKACSSTTPISTNSASISLKAKGLGSTGNITIQPLANNLQNISQFNMRGVSSPNTSTWMELGIEGYDYLSGGDILISNQDLAANTTININGNIAQYSKIVLLRADDSNNHFRQFYEFYPKYMPSGDYKISYDIGGNRYYSTISADRTTFQTNVQTYGTLMLGFN